MNSKIETGCSFFWQYRNLSTNRSKFILKQTNENWAQTLQNNFVSSLPEPAEAQFSRYLVTRTTSWLYVWYKYKVHIWTLTPTSEEYLNLCPIWSQMSPIDSSTCKNLGFIWNFCYRSRERWEQRMGSYEYWLISAPGDKTCQQTFEKLNQVTV